MTNQSNGDLVRELYQAIERKDLDAIDRLGGDARFENVTFGQTLTIREDSEVLNEAFPDLRIEVKSMVEQGDLVVVEGFARGTHEGVLRTPAGDLEPTGRRVDMPFVDVYECRDGRIASGRYYIDRMTVFEQLGVGEPPRAGATAGEEAPPPVH